ncbi:hypothetical protein [Amycolatopsis sp. WAC 04182]|uniref:hypothetical protein n=1 Tax=Amycolatopsis sp. WAC 04182 TaxID=2203198 RepID=UPI000F771FB6|nr:hypothetical protein [Amycolatopsis sp. WAC 04182]
MTAGWTGARWGELTGLRRVNTHLDDGCIVIDPDTGCLYEGNHRLWLGPPSTGLPPSADGNLRRSDAAVSIEPVRQRLTFHGLRHSHKTWMIADGIPEIAQARRLGHRLDTAGRI